METHPTAAATCSECHSTLNTNGRCLPCLLRGGLSDETVAEAAAVLAPPAVAREEAAYGDFEITRRDDGTLWELGRGAMGVTYRAVDRHLHRAVALKVVQFPARAAGSNGARTELRERFLREARAAAALQHPGIAGIYHFGAVQEAGRCYYAMELVEGETLEARVRRDGPQDAGTVLEIASQVTAALAEAATRGLIHRDLKPSNLMLESRGAPGRLAVKVIDFGLAKAAAAPGETDLTHGGFVGTPAFASPEQLERGPVDARTDIYSLGVTLWYALTGKTPFGGKTLDELRHHPARSALPVEQLEARKVPPAFVTLLSAMLAANPTQRPASARELATTLEACKRAGAGREHVGERRRPRRVALALGAVLGITLLGSVVAWWLTRSRSALPVSAHATAPDVPEKSVAVLPFANLSADKDNAFFADGVQDEVLTDLAKVADLKVISRYSVMQYKEAKQRNLREIGQTLGVAYVVEGSVQRAGGKIKVAAQLIDTRTDAHRWAEQYVRNLDDVFAIQGELAQAIAGQLQAAISPQEQAAMTQAPTHDLQAYAAYLHAREFWNSFPVQDETLYRRTVALIQEATDRDPRFARAFTFMTYVQCLNYRLFNASPAQAAVIRSLAETVARLRPGSGDAHVAAGLYRFFVTHEFTAARDEAEAAERLLPNDAGALYLLGTTEISLERWDDARAHLRQAAELDPEDTDTLNDYASLLAGIGRQAEAVSVLDRWIGTHQQAFWAHAYKSEVLLAWKGDVPAARAELAFLPPDYDPQGVVTAQRLRCDVCERDFAAAERDLAACRGEEIYGVPRAFFQGCLARYRGDAPAATAAFVRARPKLEEEARTGPESGRSLLYLATVDAALGRKEDALGERKAGLDKKLPEHNTEGPRMALLGAWVLAWAGEHDEAIRALQSIANTPAEPGDGLLRLDPAWDALRDDPRFTALVAIPASQP